MEEQAAKAIDFDRAGGVIPVVTQDFGSGRVLMLAYMNQAAFEETVASGRACYYSRSRKRLWRKGEESGNFQLVREMRLDCDGDALLLAVEQRGDGVACHLGYQSCFFQVLRSGRWEVGEPRRIDPASYGPSYGHPKKGAG